MTTANGCSPSRNRSPGSGAGKEASGRAAPSLFTFILILILVVTSLAGGVYYALSSSREARQRRQQIDELTAMQASGARARLSSPLILADYASVQKIMVDTFGFSVNIEEAFIVATNTDEVYYDLWGGREGQPFHDGLLDPELVWRQTRIAPPTGLGVIAPGTDPVATLMLGYGYENPALQSKLQALALFAAMLYKNVSEMLDTGQDDQVRVYMESIIQDNDKVLGAFAYNNDGYVLINLGVDPDGAVTPKEDGYYIDVSEPGAARGRPGRARPAIESMTGPEGLSAYRLNMPLMRAGRRVGLLQVEYDTSDYAAGAARRRTVNAVIAAAFFGMALLGALVASYWLSAPIGKLTEAAGKAADGDLTQQVDISFGGKELLELARSFNRLVTQRREAEHRLITSEGRLRELARNIIETQEDELGRLAREIHDEVGHKLVTISFITQSMIKTKPRDPELEKLHRNIEELSGELMRIYKGLSPTVIERLGLSTALRSFFDDFAAGTDTRYQLELEPIGDDDMDPRTAINVFRIMQEAATNIHRHSRADQAWVTMKRSNGRLEVEIRDNGEGFSPLVMDQSRSGLGLINMKERVAALHGDFEISSRPGGGASIRISIPLDRRAEDDHD